MGSPEFIKFADVYDKKITAFKNCLSIMNKGKYIDVNTLYTIVDGIISVVETKSDLFSYVCYLNDLDENTYLHSINVAIMCNFFGGWLKFSEEETKKLTIAGLLHDIGKSSMSDIKLNPADDLFLHPQVSSSITGKISPDS